MALLEVSNLTKQFGGLKAVSDVTCKLERGEILGLIGPNGAGKTTLFNMISGYYPPTSGTVFFEGKNITGLPPHTICRLGIARTFQICQPFMELNVLENAIVGACHYARSLKEAREEAAKALEIVGLDKKSEILAGNLSTPDRKALEFARALATKAKLLILDEPAAGLNSAEVESFLDTVINVSKKNKLTIIIVEHVLKVIMRLCSRIVVLDEGKMIAEGKSEDIARNPMVITAYLGEEYVHS